MFILNKISERLANTSALLTTYWQNPYVKFPLIACLITAGLTAFAATTLIYGMNQAALGSIMALSFITATISGTFCFLSVHLCHYIHQKIVRFENNISEIKGQLQTAISHIDQSVDTTAQVIQDSLNNISPALQRTAEGTSVFFSIPRAIGTLGNGIINSLIPNFGDTESSEPNPNDSSSASSKQRISP